jgi:hypothetical protein
VAVIEAPQDRTGMQRSALAMLVGSIILAPSLLVVSALADLRSPERTAALGAELADDVAVQSLLVDAIVDAIMEDAVARGPSFAPLVALVRPLLVDAAEATVASPAGRAAVASALADAIVQLTVPGPIIIDLRVAALAAAEEAPAPLDTLARAAVSQGVVGLIVIGADTDADVTELAPAAATTGRVAGLPGAVAVAVVALLLALAVAGLLLPSDAQRRRRLIIAGAVLTTVGAASALILRTAPGLVVDRAVPMVEVDGSPLAAVLPTLLEGLAGLLDRTSLLSVLVAVTGAAVLVAGALSGRGSRHAADPQPRG